MTEANKIQMPNITFEEWDEYLNSLKNEMLESLRMDKVMTLSHEGNIFVNLIKKINDIRLFDLSRISYLAFLFLDKYIEKNLFCLIYFRNTTGNTTGNTITTELDIILDYIIKIIIYIELSLNYHFLLLLNHLARYNNAGNSTWILANRDIKIIRFNKSMVDFHNDIKPASLLLYLMKLIKTISFMINSISVCNDSSLINLITIVRNSLNTVNNHLDEFIISIYSGVSGVSGNPEIDKYDICIKFINMIIETFYNMFNTIYQEIVKILIKTYPDDRQRLNSIGESVKSFIEMEILLIKKKFNVSR
jgi:hypothetical protein